MNELKNPSKELKLKKCCEPPVAFYKLEEYGYFASGKIVGYKKLDNNNLHLLCFNKGIYVYDLDQVVYYKKPVSDVIVAYSYVRDFRESHNSNVAAHIFTEHDGTMFFYKFDFSIKELIPICIESLESLSSLKSPIVIAHFQNRLYISERQNTILEWKHDETKDSLKHFLSIKNGVIHFSTFLENHSIFVSIYRSSLSGETIVEFFQHFIARKSVKPIKRISLGVLDFPNAAFKKTSDQIIVCVTKKRTWILKSNTNVFHRQNVGLPVGAKIFNISDNQAINSVHLHTTEDLFETTYQNLYFEKGRVKWIPRGIHSNPGTGSSIVDFSYNLQENLHVIIYGNGLIKLISSSAMHLASLRCSYDNKYYFAAQVPFDSGSQLTTLLLCGISGDRSGFFEKLSTQFPRCTLTYPFSKSLPHTCINNIWATKEGLFYDSMGTIYNSNSDTDFGKKGTWVSILGDVIEDKNEDILFIESSGSRKEGPPNDSSQWHGILKEIDTEFITIIYTDGLLELKKYSNYSGTKDILQFTIGQWIDCATIMSTHYDFRRETLHIVALLDFQKIYYWNSSEQSFEINVDPGFQVAGLLLFERNSFPKAQTPINHMELCLFVVASSFDGQVRIYSIKNKRILLEIKSAHQNEFQMAKLTDYLIFYNAFEVIMLETHSLKYGNLPLSKNLHKILPLEENKFCLLNHFSNLEFLEVLDNNISHKSDFHNFGGYFPLKMSLIPGCNNHLVVIALKRDSANTGIKLILFNFLTMEILKDHHWDTIASNVLLESYFNGIIMSYHDGKRTILRTFDFELNFIRRIYVDFIVTSLNIETSRSNPERTCLRLDGSEGICYDISDNIFGAFGHEFDHKTHSDYRIAYEVPKRPKCITWDMGNYGTYQATDVDVLKDFVTERKKLIFPNLSNYRLRPSFGNRISIDAFDKIIPYDILSITPINHFLYSIQNGNHVSFHNRPLFLINCCHNAIYILSAKYEKQDDDEM